MIEMQDPAHRRLVVREKHGTYFERVLAQMSALPSADNSYDWVFCCEALHHNNHQGMTDALREAHRVLRPGGSLLVTNEPLRWPTNLKRDHGAEVARFAGNEHVYFFPEYPWMTRRAGFHHIRITEPASDTFHSHNPIHLTLEASTLGSFKLAAINVARQQALVRRLLQSLSLLDRLVDLVLELFCDYGIADTGLHTGTREDDLAGDRVHGQDLFAGRDEKTGWSIVIRELELQHDPQYRLSLHSRQR